MSYNPRTFASMEAGERWALAQLEKHDNGCTVSEMKGRASKQVAIRILHSLRDKGQVELFTDHDGSFKWRSVRYPEIRR